jgi:fructose-1,6-bisphosphatase/inositol monophosphatase family enzyme
MRIQEYIKNAFNSSIEPCSNPTSPEEWARFGIFIGVQFFIKIRERRYLIPHLVQNEKDDGSPATLFEEILEIYAVQKLNEFYPKAGYIGEESGDLRSDNDEIVMLLDPIDGTRSFLSGLDTYSVTLSILIKNIPIFSLICNPSTGDIAFVIGKEKTKLFQVLNGPEVAHIHELPLLSNFDKLINVHPSIVAFPIIEKLYQKWGKKKLDLIRSVSGSPSLMFLETAKGCGTYINAWGKGKTYPFDIIPGLHLLNGCGGFILNRDGNPVDPWDHSGMFIAGMNQRFLLEIIDWLKK